MLIRHIDVVRVGAGFKLYVIAWIVIAVCLIVFWNDIPPYVSWPISLLEAIAAPDIDALKTLFRKTDNKRTNKANKRNKRDGGN